MKVYLLTLGCAKNQVDSEHLLGALLRAGAELAQEPQEAQALLVNTCGFIEPAKREAIQEILALARAKRRDQRLLVFGCLAERYREELREGIPEIDALWGVEATEDIVRYLSGDGAPVGLARHLGTFPYAYLKITEGCKRRCSFCCIPSIRGPHRSLPAEQILREAQGLLRAGARELVLVGQDITAYYYKGLSLAGLLRELDGLKGKFWLRLMYLHPRGITQELLSTLPSLRHLVPYLDVPLQHSEERLLRLMGRPMQRKELLRLLRRLRRTLPGLWLRSTFMVGFPGETEEEFQALLQFLEEAQIEHVGVFQFWPEEGTPAARLQGQLPQELKSRRQEELLQAQSQISLLKHQGMVGRQLEVLVEETDEGRSVARFYGQAPEVDGQVYISTPLEPGQFVKVRITHASEHDLEAELS